MDYMPQESSQRLSLLLRRRAGLEGRKAIESLFTNISSEGWSISSVFDSDVLIEKLELGARKARQDDVMTAPMQLSRADLEADIAKIIPGNMGDDLSLVATSKARQVGVIEARLSILAKALLKLVDLDGDSVLAISAAEEWGIIIQTDEDVTEEPYILEYWGLQAFSS
jgi:hypothetical protein